MEKRFSIVREIERLEERKDMAIYQRKITTCLGTVIEYDQEIGAIDRRLEQLRHDFKKHRTEQREIKRLGFAKSELSKINPTLF